MMAGLLSLFRLDPMFSIYQKIASGAPKTVPAPRYDGLIEIDDFSIPSRSRPGPALKKCMCWLQPSNWIAFISYKISTARWCWLRVDES